MGLVTTRGYSLTQLTRSAIQLLQKKDEKLRMLLVGSL
jgi:hypothetical protein